jgi:hypothetical protein
MSQHAPGFCDGHNTDVLVPSVYRWTCALSGNEIELCERCCAEWRANGVAYPDLAPSRIELVSAAPGGSNSALG